MPTSIGQWFHVAILALLGSTLTLAHVVKPPKFPDLDHAVKPPKTSDLDHAVKPPKPDSAYMVNLASPPDLDHVVKPPKSDSAYMVNLASPPDLDHVVKPPKSDSAYMVNIASPPDLVHAVKPPKPDLAYMVNLASPPDLVHAVKPPKPDSAYMVNLASPPDLDHVVKPPKPDSAYMVNLASPPDLDHVVKPPKPDPTYMVNPHSTPDLDDMVRSPKPDLNHAVKPPKPARSRKLQMDIKGGSETSNIWASDSTHRAPEHQNPQMEKTGAWATGCNGGGQAGCTNPGFYAGGEGGGGVSVGFNNIFPFPSVPFGVVVPGMSTWGGGDGYVSSNNNPGPGVNCQCGNGFPMHYVISPIPFRPMDTTNLDKMRSYNNPYNMAPSPTSN